MPEEAKRTLWGVDGTRPKLSVWAYSEASSRDGPHHSSKAATCETSLRALYFSSTIQITFTSQCAGMKIGGYCAFHDHIQSLSEYTSQVLGVLGGRRDLDMSVPGVHFSCCSSSTWFFSQRSTCPCLTSTRITGGHYCNCFLWDCWRLISGSQTFRGRDLPNEL